MYSNDINSKFNVVEETGRWNNELSKIVYDVFTRSVNIGPPLERFLWRNVVVLGVGGIGSWVSFYLARIPEMLNITLIDPDIVEISNLNRSPFQLEDVGMSKVEAMACKISSINPSIRVHPMCERFDVDHAYRWKKNYMKIGGRFHLPSRSRTLVIDCRDNYYDDYNLFEMISRTISCKIDIIRAAYDGDSITINCDPTNHIVLGDDRAGYTVVPSHVVPSSLSAMVIIIAAYNYPYCKDKEGKTHLMDRPLTFKPSASLEYIYNGSMLMRLADSGNEDAIRLLKGITDGTLVPKTH